MTNADNSPVCFDHDRLRRTGIPEAVFCPNKPLPILLELLEEFSRQESEPILFTRLAPDVFAQAPSSIQSCYTYDPIAQMAYAKTLPPRMGRVAVVSAGTADRFVALECMHTLTYFGYKPNHVMDCGVAGLWRLQNALEHIQAHDVIIAVAGFEGALPTVLAGLVSVPVLAVPTSVGYGVAQGGQAALSGMLASCAPGVSVFNIDNGYGAACAADRILRLLNR